MLTLDTIHFKDRPTAHLIIMDHFYSVYSRLMDDVFVGITKMQASIISSSIKALMFTAHTHNEESEISIHQNKRLLLLIMIYNLNVSTF